MQRQGHPHFKKIVQRPYGANFGVLAFLFKKNYGAPPEVLKK
jgi:hypothetical protein